MNDEEIINQLLNNDTEGCQKAMTLLYERHYKMISNIILKNSGNAEDAKDIFQESLLIFYKNVKSNKFKLSSKISTYLYSVAKNQWLKVLNSRDKTVYSENLENQKNIISENEIPKLDYSDEQKIIGNLLKTAGAKCKKILLLVYYEKLKMQEISTKLNLSSAQEVRNQKSKCMKKIRSLVINNDYYSKTLKSLL